MLAFGYAAKGLCTPWVSYMEISPQGELTREIFFEAPYYCMIHDFAVTRDHVIFPIVPVVGSWERLEQGLPHFGWDPSKETWLGVLPRGGEAKDVRWFSTPACFNAHIMNAWGEGSKIHIDLPVSAGNAFPFFPDITGAPFAPAPPFLERWTVDLSSTGGSFERRQIAQIPGELPRIDDRHAMSPYRYGWYGAADPSLPTKVPGGMEVIGLFFVNLIASIDQQTGQQTAFWSGEESLFQEVCFAPRAKDAPEGDGWLLSVLCNAVTRRSDLCVFDAKAVERGPVAKARLPFMLRSGVHTSWTPAAA
jgi:carotenoid cleavage dioxygenase